MIYAVYKDDGQSGPCAQGSNTFPRCELHIFEEWADFREFVRDRVEKPCGRLNPRIDAIWDAGDMDATIVDHRM